MKTKKIITLALSCLCLTILLSACSSSNTQTTNIPSAASSSKKSTMTIGEYLANDKKPILLFEIKEIDKDTPINSAYVFQNGKVTTYNLSIPLGELAKLDTNKIIDLLEDKYYQKIQKGYEREIEIWKYDASFAAFHVPDSNFTKFLITPVKNEITFELDQPTTKLKSITID